MSMLEYIYTYFGDWIENYPYMVGTIQLVIMIIMMIFLYNFTYWLVRLLGGDR